MDSNHADPPRPHVAAILWRHKVLVAAITLTAALLGFAVSALQPATYKATARLVLKDPRGVSVLEEGRQTVGLLDPTRFVRNQAQYVTGTPVLERASQLLGGRATAAQIRAQLLVEPAEKFDVINVSATAATPGGAAEVANAVGRAFQDVARAQHVQEAETTRRELLARAAALRARIEALKADIGTSLPDRTDDGYSSQRSAAVTQLLNIQDRADQVLVDASLFGAGVELFEPAQPQAAPVSPRPLGSALVAGFLGLLAATALAWWRNERRGTVRDRDDAGLVLDAPMLGEVADFRLAGVTSALPVRDAPDSPVGDAYHFLVASITHALGSATPGSGGDTVLITSAAPGEGKTVTAANLGIAAHRDGRRVLLVDADQRVQGLTGLTRAPAEPGLTDLSSDDVPLPYVTSSVPLPDGSDLPLVPAGRAADDPAGFFRSRSFRRAVERFRQAADLVILDAPPLGAVSDASAIAASVDAVVIVVVPGTPLRLLEDLHDRLALVGAPVLGYVYNRSAAPAGVGRYGYASPYAPRAGAPTKALGRLRDRVRQAV